MSDKKEFPDDFLDWTGPIELLAKMMISHPITKAKYRVTIQQLQSIFSGGGGGTSFVGAPITTTEALDAAFTPGVYGVNLPANYQDWEDRQFSLLVMPYAEYPINAFQVVIFSTLSLPFSYKIYIRFGNSAANPKWTPWGSISGGGGVGTETDPVFSAWLNTNPLANLALQSWVTENFALKESGIEPPLSETVQFTTGTNTYTITDASAENITVQAIVAGSIDYGVLTADKAVKIINAGPAVITIDGTPVGAGVTAFAIFDFATADWTISTVIDPIVPNYSDITVDQYTTTGVVLSPIGYNKITAHNLGGTSAGNLIFVNNTAQPTAIGIYQALEGGTGDIKAKKIASGTKLNVVRIKGGAVYHSEYDGANLASLGFKKLNTVGSDVIELLGIYPTYEDAVGMVVNDVLFQTLDNKLYTYSGTAWENPQSPVVNKLYLCKFDNLIYKWNGTTLVATTSPLPYATNVQAIAGTSFSRVLSPYANKYAFTTWIAPYALQSWVTENFALKESGIEPPVAEVITLTTEAPTYTVVALTAENLNVASTATNGEILLLELDADKAVRINIQSGSNPIAIAGTSYAAGVSVFAVFDFDSTTWTVNSILDPVIPDYSDIAVAQYTTTGVVLSPIGYNKITAHNLGGTSAGNLIFVNNTAQPTAIGIYQALEGGTGDIKAKKIVSGTKLNVVRIKGGAVYHSEYDGANLASLKFNLTVSLSEKTIWNKDTIPLVCSDEISDLTASTTVSKLHYVFRDSFTRTLNSLVSDLNIAGTGSTITIDIKKNGTSIFSTLLTIDAGETSNSTAVTPYVLTGIITFVAGDYIDVYVNIVGSVTAGKGLKINLLTTKS